METAKAIIFDIDGTLSPEISWTALTRDLGASVDSHIDIYQQYKEGQTAYEQSKQQLIALWQQTGNANQDYFLSLFENWPLIEGAAPLVDELKDRFRICLITGSMDLYAQTVANKLRVKDYYANTKLIWDENGRLADMDYELNQPKRKLEQFLGYCTLYNLDPSECIVVGDSDNDIALFEATKKGVAVGSDIPEALKAVAWRTISTIDQLPALLQA